MGLKRLSRASLARRLAEQGADEQAELLLAKLGLLGRPFSVTRFVRRLEAYLGIPIRLLPVECPPGTYGGLVVLEEQVFIAFRRDADPVLQRAIIFHELAHLVLAHRGVSKTRPFDERSEAEERAAEQLGGALLERALGMRPPAEMAAVDRRLAEFFG